jgi:hypothetical protein
LFLGSLSLAKKRTAYSHVTSQVAIHLEIKVSRRVREIQDMNLGP